MTATQTEIVSTTTRAVDVRDALAACLLAASKDATLPALCAVRIIKDGSELTFTATDRYRLLVATIQLDATAAESPDFAALLPVADVKRVVSLLPKRPTRGLSPMPVWFRLTGDMLTVGTFDGELTARTLDAEYPRVHGIIPSSDVELTGAPRLGFDPSHMADLCKMPGRSRNEPVILDVIAPNKPLRSTWGERESVEYLHLLMPTRVTS